MFRQNFPDDFLDDEILDFLVLHVVRVLGGDDDIDDAHRLVVFILHGNLAFGVGTQARRLCRFADAREFASELVGIHDRRGHELRGFVAGVTEHQPLVARALLGRVLCLPRRAHPRPARCRGLRGDRS
jgi:hypothetical protein